MHSSCNSVDGRSYERIWRSCGGERIGQSVTVYFSPGDPGKSINGDPSALFLNDLIPFALAVSLFPAFVAIEEKEQ